jgi:pimeloyl-ACP methyl ester carboxylesterase
MPKVTTNDGVEIAYRVFGDGGKDLVMVHGWMMSGAVYDGLIDELDLPGYRLIVPDLRATGDSSRNATEFTLARQVEDVGTVADAAGAETFGLIGHSMGGQIAQLFAATYPERVDRLMVLGSVPASGAELPPEAYELFNSSGGNREAQATILTMASVDLPEGELERLCDIAEPIPADAIQKTLVAWTSGGFEDQLSKIDAPTLVVTSDDPFLPPEFLKAGIADKIAGAEMAHVEGAGHYIQVERCAPTARLIESFFGG